MNEAQGAWANAHAPLLWDDVASTQAAFETKVGDQAKFVLQNHKIVMVFFSRYCIIKLRIFKIIREEVYERQNALYAHRKRLCHQRKLRILQPNPLRFSQKR